MHTRPRVLLVTNRNHQPCMHHNTSDPPSATVWSSRSAVQDRNIQCTTGCIELTRLFPFQQAVTSPFIEQDEADSICEYNNEALQHHQHRCGRTGCGRRRDPVEHPTPHPRASSPRVQPVEEGQRDHVQRSISNGAQERSQAHAGVQIRARGAQTRRWWCSIQQLTLGSRMHWA